ncbi:hypothetical protein A2165_01355 [Candidatus Curtissbacteria bacterium RBG_13_40_7]|uniref:Uncharacterized protein n=1 Tax=Candidatus Curtissbacteria bacterium RBG_13_40_7 TaxID=1797706 RepID=A0A1F5FWU4_9BACT|nr:MAG: hypothetical protein A2165_01355 [Candidatus Curtissbacteria bacterium RBG_13_40_7]
MDPKEAGYKFHMNDIAATMALVGLKESDKLLEHRKKIVKYYIDHLNLSHIDANLPYVVGGSYWLFAVLINYRDELAKYLFEKNIDSNLVHLRNDISKILGGRRQKLPNMNYIEPRYLYLPLHAKMTLKDAKTVVDAVNSFIKKRRIK